MNLFARLYVWLVDHDLCGCGRGIPWASRLCGRIGERLL